MRSPKGPDKYTICRGLLGSSCPARLLVSQEEDVRRSSCLRSVPNPVKMPDIYVGNPKAVNAVFAEHRRERAALWAPRRRAVSKHPPKIRRKRRAGRGSGRGGRTLP